MTGSSRWQKFMPRISLAASHSTSLSPAPSRYCVQFSQFSRIVLKAIEIFSKISLDSVIMSSPDKELLDYVASLGPALRRTHERVREVQEGFRRANIPVEDRAEFRQSVEEQVEELERRLKETREEIARCEASRLDLEAKVADAGDYSGEVVAKMKEWLGKNPAAVVALQKEFPELVAAGNARVVEIMKSGERLEEEVKACRCELDSLCVKLCFMQTTAKRNEKQAETAEKSQRETEERVKQLEEEMVALKESLSTQLAENLQLKEEICVRVSEIDAVDSARLAAEAQRVRLEKELMREREENEGQDHRVGSLEEELASLRDQMQRAQVEVESEKRDRRQLEKEKAELEALLLGASVETENLENGAEIQQVKIAEVTGQLEASEERERAESSRARLEHKSAQADALVLDVATANRRVGEVESQLVQKTAQAGSLELELVAQKEKVEEYKGQLERKSAEAGTLEIEAAAERQRREEVQGQLADKIAQVEALQKELEESRGLFQKLSSLVPMQGIGIGQLPELESGITTDEGIVIAPSGGSLVAIEKGAVRVFRPEEFRLEIVDLDLEIVLEGETRRLHVQPEACSRLEELFGDAVRRMIAASGGS